MLKLVAAIIGLGLATFGAVVLADSPDKHEGNYKALLTGFQAVPPVITEGRGEAVMTVRRDSADVKVEYAGLSAAPMMVSIQFAQPGVIGGPVFLVCGGTEKACSGTSGQAEVSITAAKVLGAPSQGVEAGQLAPVLQALDAGLLYVNVATAKFPAGEIRGQLMRGNRHGDDVH